MNLKNTAGGVVAALVALAGLIPAATPAFAAPVRSALPAAVDIAQCVPSNGLGVVDPSGPAKPNPTDNNVNVYAGGTFLRVAGAEAEGQMVVNGDADFGSGLYNSGLVGVGSGLQPAGGSDVIRVGGNLTISSGEIQVGIKDQNGAFLESNVKIGGAKHGAGAITINGASGAVQEGLGREAALGSPSFSDWPSNDYSVLKDFAQRNVENAQNVEGSATLQWGTLRLDGDASAARHAFTLDGSTLTPFSLQVGDNIDPNEPIIITVTGTSPVVNIQGLYDANMVAIDTASARFSQLASQILWVFPDATTLRLDGAQLPGSVVVPTANSTTTMAAAGSNGRVWVAGDLVQNRAGSEFHNFPFIGDTGSTCNEPPAPNSEDTEVAPVAPAVEQGKCVEGEAVAPTVTLPNTEGINYTLNGEVKAGNTVTITATPNDGVKLIAADGWTLNEDGTATYTVVLDETDCETTPPTEDTEVAPVAPAVEQGKCVEGEAVAPTVTLPNTEGINYTLNGEVKAGNTVTITATPNDGVKLIAADGWTLNEDGTATYTVVLDEVKCAPTGEPTESPIATPAPDTKDPGTKDPGTKDKDTLANTGLDTLPFLALGLFLAAAGALIVATRRKKA